ncbi:MAG: AI-2E family transporter [Pseudomonadota bacterium]|nr:AI-2E family transporter [Pseudomonadota bacterium]
MVAAVAEPAPALAAEAAPPRTRPVSPLVVWVSIIGVIAVVASLYLARAFFVPLLIGILTSYALRPLVDWLKDRRIPRPLGAALVMATLLAGVSWATVSLSEDASATIAKLPEAARKVRERMRVASEGGPSSLQKIQEAATELQGAATDATAATPERKPAKKPATAITVRDAEPVWMRDYMVAQSALLFTVAAQAPIVLLLAYFLLASGAHFRRKLVQLVGPSLSRKKDAVRILEEIDTQIQRYLMVTVGSNVLVGLGTWLAFEAMGMEQAGVWGIAAGVLHFVPYLGPVVFAIATGFAAFLQFGTAVGALSVAGVSLLVAAAVGSLFVTWVQSRFARINAAVLFIALLFFGWLWGIWGLLLGAPLVAIAKVICDRVEALSPVGDLLGN